MNVTDFEFKDLLTKYQMYTVYGLSPDPSRASHYVTVYMRNRGWKMIGTYPEPHAANDFRVFETLSEVPLEYRKFVNVFRGSNVIPRIVDEIIELGGVEVLWLQLGISNSKAEERAESAGIKVVSDRCLIIEHQKYFI